MKKFRIRLPEVLAVAAVLGFTSVCAYILWVVSGYGAYSPAASKSGKAAVSQSAFSSAGSPSSSAGKALTIKELVLVNSGHRLPDWYQPSLVKTFGITVDSEVVQPFTRMKNAAARDGVSLWISSAYRSTVRQEELFKQEIEQYNKIYPDYQQALAYAEKSVAKPGYSEHATGLALDLNGVKDDFDQTPAFRWLNAYAQEYGFILRYPKDKQNITQIKYEPWHYRYVGVNAAKEMKEKGLCLEEYLNEEEKANGAN